MILETERLILREYTWADFDRLYEILSDPETMAHYPKPYDAAGVRRWIEWSLDNYEKYGFGLWAVELKETGAFIGDCGLTMQNIDGSCCRRSATTSTRTTGGGVTPAKRPGPSGIGPSQTGTSTGSIPT